MEEARPSKIERKRASNYRYRRTAKGREAQSRARTVHRSGCDAATYHRCRSSRCVICNVAPWTVARYLHKVMQVGHLVPGDAAGGFEPMCPKCNRYLGARRLTQVTGREVLHRSRHYWSWVQMRAEAWQHTDVDERGYGFGGLSESPGRQRKLDAFEEEKHARREQREG